MLSHSPATHPCSLDRGSKLLPRASAGPCRLARRGSSNTRKAREPGMARATRETSLAPAQPVQGGATDQGMMQMGLTKEEIVELQKVLSLGPGMEQEDEVELDGNSDLTE
eukprot:scaffold139_cov21-Tisochrysis_lutea.AAC.1